MRKFFCPGGKRRTAFLVCALIWCALPCGGQSLAQEKKKIVFLPMWSPQAQFAGYYVAQEKGFYAREGLDVSILTGGPDALPQEYLKSGQADIALLWLSSAIRARAQGLELVNIAQVMPRSALMLVSRASSGIRSPRDLANKRVSLWQGDLGLQPKALLRSLGICVQEIPQGTSVNLFLRGGVDAVSAMWYNEYHQILSAGLDETELTSFFLSRYGFDFPEDGVYLLRSTYEKDPSAARAFVRASLEGWRYAFLHPEEALNIVLAVMERAHVPANRTHQRWMLLRLKDLIEPVGEARLRESDYARVAGELKEAGFIEQIVPFASFCSGGSDDDAAH